ncbi:hypothetical protein ABPG72_022499 [Tetrahymena utriculariae]
MSTGQSYIALQTKKFIQPSKKIQFKSKKELVLKQDQYFQFYSSYQWRREMFFLDNLLSPNYLTYKNYESETQHLHDGLYQTKNLWKCRQDKSHRNVGKKTSSIMGYLMQINLQFEITISEREYDEENNLCESESTRACLNKAGHVCLYKISFVTQIPLNQNLHKNLQQLFQAKKQKKQRQNKIQTNLQKNKIYYLRMRKLAILVLLALVCLAQAGNFRLAQQSGVTTTYQFNSVNLSQCDPSQYTCPCDPSDVACNCWTCYYIGTDIYCFWICDQ